MPHHLIRYQNIYRIIDTVSYCSGIFMFRWHSSEIVTNDEFAFDAGQTNTNRTHLAAWFFAFSWHFLSSWRKIKTSRRTWILFFFHVRKVNKSTFLRGIPSLREGSLIAPRWRFYGVLKMAKRPKKRGGRKSVDRDWVKGDPARAPRSSVWKTYGAEGRARRTSEPLGSKK